MNRIFDRCVDKNTPPINKHVMIGVAYEFMKKALPYLDDSFRSISKSLPSCIKYVGIERCTPLEEYMVASKPRENKRSFDLAKSNTYMVKFMYVYVDPATGVEEPIKPVYCYVVYADPGGTMMISGALYHLTPVLSDKVISPGRGSVFIRLLKDKITMRSGIHTVSIDNMLHNVSVIWGNIYKKTTDKVKVAITTNANTCVAHYLFAKYGIRAAFKKYANVDIIYGTSDIDTINYPKDEWVIIGSSRIKPKSCKDGLYEPTKIRLAIPRKQWTKQAYMLAIGFFYVVDHFPYAFKAEEMYFDDRSINLCKRLLASILKSGNYGHDKLIEIANEHYRNLDNYLDTHIRMELKEIGLVFETFYDLIFHVSVNFVEFTNDSEQRILSMFNKKLEVVYNTFFDITSALTKATYHFEKMQNKSRLNAATAYEILSKFITAGLIFKLNSGKNVVSQVGYSGDHYYFKLACSVTDQETIPTGSGTRKAKRAVGPDQHLHPSMVVCGSILFLQKKNPTPISHLNPYVKIDMDTGTIQPNKKFTPILDDLYKKLTVEEHAPVNNEIDLLDEHDVDSSIESD